MPRDVGQLLPAVRVTDARVHQDRRVPWQPDGVSVLVFTHGSCRRCDAFVQDLDDEAASFADWGARIRSVVADPSRARTLVERVRSDVLLDDRGDLHRAAAVDRDHAAVVITDVHGQVFFSRDLDEHEMPSVAQVLAEARFPSLQCPECDTPDVPSRSVMS